MRTPPCLLVLVLGLPLSAAVGCTAGDGLGDGRDDIGDGDGDGDADEDIDIVERFLHLLLVLHALGPDECRTADDCGPYPSGEPACAPPERVTFARGVCGACLDAEDECATDDDCGPGLVCRGQGPCGCGEATLVCVEGCQSDDDCLTGQTCDADAHCVPTTCIEDADCPSQFECIISAGGKPNTCSRVPCSIDDDCQGGGWCVNNACFDAPGQCLEDIPVP